MNQDTEYNVGVVNYGTGNFSSVFNALCMCGMRPMEVALPHELNDVPCIILPGVGTFVNAMKRLRKLELLEALAEHVLGMGKPFLGICVGMQILADRGHEVEICDGLGWIPGEVCRMSVPGGVRLPHIGWDDIEVCGNTRVLEGLPEVKDFYFVHSYHMVAEVQDDVLAACDYGGRFIAALHHDNIYGVQFHPEKSQENGLRLLRNFVELAR